MLSFRPRLRSTSLALSVRFGTSTTWTYCHRSSSMPMLGPSGGPAKSAMMFPLGVVHGDDSHVPPPLRRRLEGKIEEQHYLLEHNGTIVWRTNSPPSRALHTTRYLKYPSLSNWSTMLVSTNEAGSAVAAFGVVPLIARRVFL